MRRARIFLVFAAMIAGVALTGCTTARRADAGKETVLFMCPYGGAKSVIAASYFNRLAEAEGLPYVATAAAAETPYEAVPQPVAEYLGKDGFAVASFKPRQVTAADLESAVKVVSIDCDVAKLDARGAAVEQWNDVPKVSADLPGSAAAIRRHVEQLAAELKAKRP
jgi:protein-tyrosine-phosphatase